MSTPTLELKNKYYAVTDGTVFSYYPVTFEDPDSNPSLIRLIKSPPLLLEGYIIVAKKIYQVTTQDLFRKIIRKSRLVTLESINGSSINALSSIPYSTDSITSARETLQHLNQSRANSATELEVSQAINSAWENQIGTLLNLENEEEGIFSEAWEIENITQS
jgi:hypothetical protein